MPPAASAGPCRPAAVFGLYCEKSGVAMWADILAGHDHRVHGRDLALAGHDREQRLGAVEAGDAPGERGEGEPAGREEVERGRVRRRVDAERPGDAELLVDDLIRIEVGRARAVTTCSRDDDRPAATRERDRLREGGGCLGRDVDDDVGETAGRVPQRADGVGRADVDREVGAELWRDLEPGKIALAAS